MFEPRGNGRRASSAYSQLLKFVLYQATEIKNTCCKQSRAHIENRYEEKLCNSTVRRCIDIAVWFIHCDMDDDIGDRVYKLCTCTRGGLKCDCPLGQPALDLHSWFIHSSSDDPM